MEPELNTRKLALFIPFVHLFLFFSIAFDIPVFRQIIFFVYLSFIPGFTVLKILKLKEIRVVETVLFAVGLSIAFLMFVGLLINELYPILGVSQPLSTAPLTITLSLLTLILFFVGYRHDLSENFSSIERNFIDLKAILMNTAVLVLLVLLGIIGALYVNQLILLLMITAIAALYALSIFRTKSILSKSYPLLIFAISMTLTISLLLTSRYIIGFDSPLEYYVFRLTAINRHWRLLSVGINELATANFNSMLSITILPAIYAALLNINGEMIFKIFYPFVFSLVPVVLYRTYERQIGKSASLLSTLLLISSPLVFYGVEPLSLNRQMIAEFFLVLSIFILVDEKISFQKRKLLLIVFSAAIVVSHYSMMYLYLMYVLCMYAISKIKGKSDNVLNGAIVFLLFVMAFSWYIYTFSPVESLYQFIYTLFSRFFIDILNPAARSSSIFRLHPVLTFAGVINWGVFYMVHFFIVVGVLRLLFKSKTTRLDPKYRVLSILSAIILLICVVVPNFAPALNFERFYAIALLFLAPCFFLGGETFVHISENLLKRVTSQHFSGNENAQKRTILLCTVLIVYFLSQSGFINCVTRAAPLSYLLDFERTRTSSDKNLQINFARVYIPEQDVFSAVWLSKYMAKSSTLYADYVRRFQVLTSYGLIPRPQIQILPNATKLEQGDLIYLGELNIVKGIIDTGAEPFNTSKILYLLDESNLIYSNANSEIWRVCSQG